MTKTYTIGAVAIYTSLQPFIHQFMILHFKNLGHTHPGINTAAYKGEDGQPKKDTE